MSEPWDAIDPTALLPLIGVRRMTRQFGFLLRHYWMPATELTYRRQTIQRDGQSHFEPYTEQVVQRLARCDADTCCWREVVTPGTPEQGVVRLFPFRPEGHFCIYNRSDQTFRTKGITDHAALPETEREARIQAFVRQPILTSLLPIPLGFQWHVSTDEGDYMDFTLLSEADINDMPLVFVRRQGQFHLDGIGTVHREGITAFALERSTILEDRTRDLVSETGLEIKTETKLVQSRLVE